MREKMGQNGRPENLFDSKNERAGASDREKLRHLEEMARLMGRAPRYSIEQLSTALLEDDAETIGRIKELVEDPASGGFRFYLGAMMLQFPEEDFGTLAKLANSKGIDLLTLMIKALQEIKFREGLLKAEGKILEMSLIPKEDE